MLVTPDTGVKRSGNLTDAGRRVLYAQTSLVDALQRRLRLVVRPGR